MMNQPCLEGTYTKCDVPPRNSFRLWKMVVWIRKCDLLLNNVAWSQSGLNNFAAIYRSQVMLTHPTDLHPRYILLAIKSNLKHEELPLPPLSTVEAIGAKIHINQSPINIVGVYNSPSIRIDTTDIRKIT